MSKTEDYSKLANVICLLDDLEDLMVQKDNERLECTIEGFKFVVNSIRQNLADIHNIASDDLSETLNLLMRLHTLRDETSKSYAGVIRSILMPVVQLFAQVAMLLEQRRRGINTPYRTFKQNATQDTKKD